MNVIGHGIDLVEIARIEQMLADHGERFLDRCFTADEQAYAASTPRRKAERLAARFAAKEAALKALGTGWSRGIAWTDVEVERHASGMPALCVRGHAQRHAARAGITGWLVSLSHTDSHAMASVIALGER